MGCPIGNLGQLREAQETGEARGAVRTSSHSGGDQSKGRNLI
jgi:hypothetical protein